MITVEAFESRVLVGNPLGDPTTRRIPVYLPPGYDAEPDRRYPLVVALAGFTGTGLSFLNYDFYQANLAHRRSSGWWWISLRQLSSLTCRK